MASFNAAKLLRWNLRQPLHKRIHADNLPDKLEGKLANIRGRLLLHSILAEPAMQAKIKQIYTLPDGSMGAHA